MNRQFVSYPKSGRTWNRYIFTILGLEECVDFHHDGFEFNDGTKPSHDFNIIERNIYDSEVDKIIYLHRDPRDIMVSLYFQVTGRFRDYFHYEDEISSFLRDEYFGAWNLKRFRDCWNEICFEGGALAVSYEQCHVDMFNVMRNILSYYQLSVPDKELNEAIEKSTFGNMKKVEEKGEFNQPWLRPRNNSYKVRSGRVGSFVDYLNDNDIQYLNKIFNLG